MKKTLIAWGMLLAACGGREARWDAQVEGTTSYGLQGSVALRDEALNRLLLVTSPAEHELTVTPFPIGKNVAAIESSLDKQLLFVLSKGEHPRFRPEDERPQLTVIHGGPTPKVTHQFSLDDPLLKLAVDPRREWIAAYQADSTVINPNELVLFSLEDGESEPRTRTIRSFGGFPLELVFTDPLTMPSGAQHRFLIVRTDRDITLVDLTDLRRSEITVGLPQLDEDRSSTPVEVVFDDGDPDDPTDTHLAIRLSGESDIVLVSFAAQSEGQGYRVQPNIVDAGGVPSAIDFVRTDGGSLRLAALVPSRRRATLIDPAGTSVETVEFPLAYSRMTRITDSLSSSTPEDGDVALLWSPEVRGIAFWSLGETSSTPYRSVDATSIDLAVGEVVDVPAPYRHIKLLSGTGADRFFVLDLESRQTFPMLTRGSGFRVNVAPDGRRLWAFQSGHGDFSSIDLADLHPTSLSVRLRVSQIHDIERADGTRAALVLHGSESSSPGGNVSATLLDALRPDSADTRFFSGLYSEGF